MTNQRVYEGSAQVNENCTGSINSRLSYLLVNRKAKARKQERRKKHTENDTEKRTQTEKEKKTCLSMRTGSASVLGASRHDAADRCLHQLTWAGVGWNGVTVSSLSSLWMDLTGFA